MSDVVERAEAALEGARAPGGMNRVNADLLAAVVAELKAARAEVERLLAFADELENTTELSNGAPSVVARSFAAEIRRRLRGEAR